MIYLCIKITRAHLHPQNMLNSARTELTQQRKLMGQHAGVRIISHEIHEIRCADIVQKTLRTFLSNKLSGICCTYKTLYHFAPPLHFCSTLVNKPAAE